MIECEGAELPANSKRHWPFLYKNLYILILYIIYALLGDITQHSHGPRLKVSRLDISERMGMDCANTSIGNLT